MSALAFGSVKVCIWGHGIDNVLSFSVYEKGSLGEKFRPSDPSRFNRSIGTGSILVYDTVMYS